MRHVMLKDGKSYVKLDGYRSGKFLINGVEPVKCKGNPSWAEVNGDITEIKKLVKKPAVLKEFNLRSKFVGKTTLLLTKDADSFYRDDYDWLGEDVEFYEPVYNEPEIIETIEEFEVIDRNCMPVSMPNYIKVEFRNNIAKYPETQHLYPCSINYKEVYDRVHDRLVAIVRSNPDRLICDDYKNIQTLTIQEIITVPYHAEKTVHYYPTMRSKKMKKKIVQETKRNAEILKIVGEYKSNTAIQVASVSGDNYADLQIKLEEYIQSFEQILSFDSHEVCDKCKGTGITKRGVET